MTSQSSFARSSVNGSSLLKEKYAVVFGAGGSVGAAVAKEFAAEGAEVFLAGRNRPRVQAVSEQIAKAGGRAHTHVVDALDEAAVEAYIEDIVKQAGRIDILFNAVGPLAAEYGNGKNAVNLPGDEFMVPLTTVVKSHFMTSRVAARHMLQQHSGVIIFLTGSPAREHATLTLLPEVGIGQAAYSCHFGIAGVRPGVIYARTSTNVSGGFRTPIQAVCLSSMNVSGRWWR